MTFWIVVFACVAQTCLIDPSQTDPGMFTSKSACQEWTEKHSTASVSLSCTPHFYPEARK